jgi:uncharacterized protein YhaN
MKLQRVEAVRYGDLTDARLGEFKDELVVVLGNNEAGKSTFTSLVRHVLYGFPRGRTTERLYQPPTGDQRVGRLLFADGKSSWVVERTEGAHGGEVSVHGPQGEEPGGAFLEALTRGVSATIYRSVFAFALEELSDLASLEGIQSRLYATTAGLRVNPHDVLEKLRSRADDIWAPRARTKQLHKLNSELRTAREERRRLEELSERYRTDRERLAVVSLLLDQSEVDVRTLRLEEERLSALLAEGRRLVERMREDEQEAAEQRLEAEKAQREVSRLEVDEALLENSDGLDRLGARFELFVAEAGLLREDEGRLGPSTARPPFRSTSSSRIASRRWKSAFGDCGANGMTVLAVPPRVAPSSMRRSAPPRLVLKTWASTSRPRWRLRSECASRRSIG